MQNDNGSPKYWDRDVLKRELVLTLRQLHPTKAQRDGGLGFGAVEIGNGTLNNLERYLSTIGNG